MREAGKAGLVVQLSEAARLQMRAHDRPECGRDRCWVDGQRAVASVVVLALGGTVLVTVEERARFERSEEMGWVAPACYPCFGPPAVNYGTELFLASPIRQDS